MVGKGKKKKKKKERGRKKKKRERKKKEKKKEKKTTKEKKKKPFQSAEEKPLSEEIKKGPPGCSKMLGRVGGPPPPCKPAPCHVKPSPRPGDCRRFLLNKKFREAKKEGGFGEAEGRNARNLAQQAPLPFRS